VSKHICYNEESSNITTSSECESAAKKDFDSAVKSTKKKRARKAHTHVAMRKKKVTKRKWRSDGEGGPGEGGPRKGGTNARVMQMRMKGRDFNMSEASESTTKRREEVQRRTNGGKWSDTQKGKYENLRYYVNYSNETT